ncbi:hypothetical protein LU293_05180 [Moraxella nasovis]|uniref:hypothetical protein n=1 Tax=Moraxella nasovis TaxID=2904121 RepID=UPI001F60367E|nr:hypothetical protein [Moraxella nasovis]UNU72518.1 hypothetical protein LU293_05180 [Moraxella nasovis]
MNHLLIRHITDAIRFANISIFLGIMAIGSFFILGTLASLNAFKDSMGVYLAFHYLPYVLVGLSIPISLYHVFLLGRYHIIQKSILRLILGVGIGLFGFTLAVFIAQGSSIVFFMSLFLTMIAWFGMPFVFRVNFKRFLTFLTHSSKQTDHHD